MSYDRIYSCESYLRDLVIENHCFTEGHYTGHQHGLNPEPPTEDRQPCSTTEPSSLHLGIHVHWIVIWLDKQAKKLTIPEREWLLSLSHKPHGDRLDAGSRPSSPGCGSLWGYLPGSLVPSCAFSQTWLRSAGCSPYACTCGQLQSVLCGWKENIHDLIAIAT